LAKLYEITKSNLASTQRIYIERKAKLFSQAERDSLQTPEIKKKKKHCIYGKQEEKVISLLENMNCLPKVRDEVSNILIDCTLVG